MIYLFILLYLIMDQLL